MEKFYTSEIENEQVSKMSLDDRMDYLSFIKEYLIDYRETLHLPSRSSFGVEIEYQGVPKEIVDEYIEGFGSFASHEEGDFEIGGEVVSRPLIDNFSNWYDLKEILIYMSKLDGIYTNGRAGAHVHMGAQMLKSEDAFKRFLLLYAVYENIIYRFAYMDRNKARDNISTYAEPMRVELSRDYESLENCKSLKELKKEFDRYHGLNFKNIRSFKNFGDRNTIEFRMANGTLDPVLWQNTINLYAKLLLASHTDMDIDRLDYLLQRKKLANASYSEYGSLRVDEAFDFADIVFNNMLDKTNFLRQYIKDGNNSVDTCESKVQKFTRY